MINSQVLKWKNASLILVIFLSVLTIGIKLKAPKGNFISYDNFGYYMYLPGKYIYHDMSLKTDWYKVVNEKYKCTSTYFQLIQTPNGAKIIRFYRGMSIIWTPAFFTAHQVAKILDFPQDGFSLPYQWALIIYGGLFSIIGLIVSRKILLKYFDERVTFFTLILLYVGTNLFFFINLGNDVPHVYIFTLITLVIWFTIRWHEDFKLISLILIGISLGLILAIRPSDIIYGILPVLWGVYNKDTLYNKMRLIKEHFIKIELAFLIMIVFFIPQLFYYYKYANEILVNVYSDAGSTLDLSNPRFAYVLFGFRKGWFIYSPLSLLSVFGLIFCYKKMKVYFWPALIILFINIYLIASFTSLVSYGWRAFIESYAILILPTAFVIDYILKQKNGIRIISATVLTIFIILNIHQAYQVRVGIIDGSRMTKEYYMEVLGKNRVSEDTRKLLLVERSTTEIDSIPENYKFYTKKLLDLNFNDIKSLDSISPLPYEGKGVFCMGDGVEFSPGIKVPYHQVTNDYYCYLHASVYVYARTSEFMNKIYLVITTSDSEHRHLKYRSASFGKRNNFVSGQWNRLSIDYLTPEVFTGNEIINSYVWYTGKGNIWIDKFEITAFSETK